MISYKEVDPTGSADATTRANIEDLLKRVNIVRAFYGKSMTVSSGLRDMKKHLEIYAKKNADLKAKGLPEVKVPMASKHLYGQALDIADPKGELQKWCKDNLKTLEDTGLYMEDFAYTAGWVHFQSLPPKSGKRYFIP